MTLKTLQVMLQASARHLFNCTTAQFSKLGFLFTWITRGTKQDEHSASPWILRPHRRQPTRLPRPWNSPGKNIGVGCHFLLQCVKVKSEREVARSCPTLSNPTPWTTAYQAPLFMEFSRQEYWSGVPLPSKLCQMDCHGQVGFGWGLSRSCSSSLRNVSSHSVGLCGWVSLPGSIPS